jgi:tRNA splicing ligase
MTTFTLTGEATLTLYDRVFTDLADGDVSTVTFPNNLVELKTGKNRNTIYSRNAMGENGEMVLRLVRGSSDDRFLQGKLSLMERDFISSELCNGQLAMRLGDGNGTVVTDVYTLGGGLITKKVEGKENVEGDTTQAVSVYNLKFANVTRSAQ